jgi:hypothetical protein
VDLVSTVIPMVIAIGCVRLWAWWVARDQARHAERYGHLSYGSAVKSGAAGCAVLAACAITTAHSTATGHWLVSAATATILTFGAIWFLLEAHMVELRYDERAIEATSRLGGKRVVPWSAITGWRYVRWADTLILETRKHGTLRVSGHLAGLPAFIEKLAERISAGRAAANPG